MKEPQPMNSKTIKRHFLAINMKTQLDTLHKMLAYQLEGMYNAEKRIQNEVPELVKHLDAGEAVEIMSRYAESANDKRLKLKRVFSYLLMGPFSRSICIVETVLEESADVVHLTSKDCHRDLLIMSAFEALSEYKLTCYNTALKVALQLELTKVAELLEDIIAWELESLQTMSEFASQGVVDTEPHH
jgi:ferritin-like metal-binding protein YciE